jgi:outer membrane protein TolC
MQSRAGRLAAIARGSLAVAFLCSTLGSIALGTAGIAGVAAADEAKGATDQVEGRQPIGIARDEAAREAVSAIETELRNRASALDRSYPGPRAPKRSAGSLEWWTKDGSAALLAGEPTIDASLESCFDRALRHSTQIRVFSDLPLIRETGIAEAEGMWTPRAFAEGKWQYNNDPVGNILTTGKDGRFRQSEETLESGVRKRFTTGAEAVVSQRWDHLDNNSVAQPLLKGMGITYNRSLYDLARLDTEMAREELRRQVESHLVEITRAYWGLYLARANYVQKQRITDETGSMTRKLEARAELDVDRTQLLRSRSAFADRQADLLRARIAIENAAARLRSLLNDPELDRGAPVEVVPSDSPELAYGDVTLREIVEDAVQHRPEIRQAYLQYEAAAVREGMARNEARQTLDLILEASLGGLDANWDLGQSWTEGWEHTPGAIVGLRYEFPIGQDEADARLQRRRIELRQQGNQVRTTLNTVILEAEVTGNEYATAAAELDARLASLRAASEDLALLTKRWHAGLGGDTISGATYLDAVLDAQDRLAEAEARLVASQVTYRVAVANLERVRGRMLSVENVEIVEQRPEEGLPSIELQRKE